MNDLLDKLKDIYHWLGTVIQDEQEERQSGECCNEIIGFSYGAQSPPVESYERLRFIYHRFIIAVLSREIDWSQCRAYAMLVDTAHYNHCARHESIDDIPSRAVLQIVNITGKRVLWEGHTQKLFADDVEFKDVPDRGYAMVVFVKLPGSAGRTMLACYINLVDPPVHRPSSTSCSYTASWNDSPIMIIG